MKTLTPASPLEGFLDEADARIMEVVYQWASINFGFDVGTWIQDSTEIRDILHDALSRAFEEGVREGLSQGFPKVAQDAASEVCGISTKVGYATSEDGSLRIPQFGICQSPRGRCLIHSPAREPEPHPPTTTDQ